MQHGIMTHTRSHAGTRGCVQHVDPFVSSLLSGNNKTRAFLWAKRNIKRGLWKWHTGSYVRLWNKKAQYATPSYTEIKFGLWDGILTGQHFVTWLLPDARWAVIVIHQFLVGVWSWFTFFPLSFFICVKGSRARTRWGISHFLYRHSTVMTPDVIEGERKVMRLLPCARRALPLCNNWVPQFGFCEGIFERSEWGVDRLAWRRCPPDRNTRPADRNFFSSSLSLFVFCIGKFAGMHCPLMIHRIVHSKHSRAYRRPSE